MTIHELPADWLKPGSEGLKLIGGRAAQLLLLIPCSRCSHLSEYLRAKCMECRGSGAPGFHAMRAPLAEVFEALMQARRAPGWLEPKTAAERLVEGALPAAEVREVRRHRCPRCTWALRSLVTQADVEVTYQCTNHACGAVFELLADCGHEGVILAVEN